HPYGARCRIELVALVNARPGRGAPSWMHIVYSYYGRHAWERRHRGKIAENADETCPEQRNDHSIHRSAANARRLTIGKAETYVRRMTTRMDGGRRLACQGLHNAPVLPYGSSRTVRLPVARRRP